MQFRIADTFTDSLARLTGDEQKAVKTAAFDLQMNPAHPGLKLHQVDRAKEKDFWSVRVSRDIRLIVHRTASSFLLCYVDHHDAAYQWAERRRLEQHPRTGAAQLVEIRQTVREIRVPRYVEVDVPASTQDAAPGGPAVSRTAIFADASDDDLLGYGVPVEWLGDVRTATGGHAACRRATRGAFDERHRAAPLRGQCGPPQLGVGRRHPGAAPAGGSRCGRPPFRCPLPLDGMERGGRRLAARALGGLPRRPAARPQDTGRRIRSGDRPTGSSRPSSPTSMATLSSAEQRSRCSTDRHPR